MGWHEAGRGGVGRPVRKPLAGASSNINRRTSGTPGRGTLSSCSSFKKALRCSGSAGGLGGASAARGSLARERCPPFAKKVVLQHRPALNSWLQRHAEGSRQGAGPPPPPPARLAPVTLAHGSRSAHWLK